MICEIEPPTRPDLTHVRRQIGTLGPVVDDFLVPDNHIGRATVSSIAVASEVQSMGGRSIACVNARDRNLLGFRRDLLTAAAYGVTRFLLVHGDAPTVGGRSSDLTVRTMMREARASNEQLPFAGSSPFQVGVTAHHTRRLPPWKHNADFILLQVGYSLTSFLRWRESHPVDIPVFAGVMVLASPEMAVRLRASIPDIHIPDDLVEEVAANREAGVDAACELLLELRASGAFAGVHLVPVSRFREVASRLGGAMRLDGRARAGAEPFSGSDVPMPVQ